MLSKNFKSNKFYEVTRYVFKYGNETDEMSNSITVWDSLEKAKAYIDRYAKGLKFASAQIEVNNLDREITYEDYKKGNYNIVSFQKIYDVTLDGTEDTQPEEIIYTADEEVEQAQATELTYEVEEYVFGVATEDEAMSVAKELANKKSKAIKVYKNGEQIAEVKPQATEEKEYIFFSPKTGRYAARRFRGTEEAVIADTERRIEERDYARDFCLVIREVISKGKSKFIKAINWNDDYRIACGWYSEIVYSKEEAMKKAQELANKENKAVNVYITTLNNNGHAVEELIDTVKPFKGQTYEINGRWFTLATEEEAVNLAQSMANAKNRVVRINRNGVEIAEVKPEQKYNFYITDYTEDRELPTFYEGYTKKEITNMVKEWSEKNNHVYKIYIYDRTSDKGIAGRVFFKVINWKQIYKVGKTGSRLRFGEFLYEEAEKYCKEYAEKDGIAYTIYEVKLDEYGRDDTVQVY